jgi:excisionase family DNA binding protein
MYTVREVAARLKLSSSAVYNAVKSGELPHYRFGGGRGTIRVSEEQLGQFLERTKVEARLSTPVHLRDIQHSSRAA